MEESIIHTIIKQQTETDDLFKEITEIYKDKNLLINAENVKKIFQDEYTILQILKNNKYSLLFAPDEKKNDLHFISQCVKINGLSLKYTHASLKKNKHVVELAIKQNKYSIYYADNEIISDEKFLIGNLNKLIEITKIRDGYMNEYCEIDNNIINYIFKKCNYNKNVIKEAINLNHNSIYYVPKNKLTTEMIEIINIKWKEYIYFEYDESVYLNHNGELECDADSDGKIINVKQKLNNFFDALITKQNTKNNITPMKILTTTEEHDVIFTTSNIRT
jgi:hypothetical protein